MTCQISPRAVFQERDQVRRFITLIDALYESHAKVVCTAALDPISLFPWRLKIFQVKKNPQEFRMVFCILFCDGKFTKCQFLTERLQMMINDDGLYGMYALRAVYSLAMFYILVI